MAVALGQYDGEARAALAVITDLGADLAVVHLGDGLAEVQADARTFQSHIVGIAALVEAVEDVCGILGLDADAGVDDRQRHVRLRFAQHDLHLAAVEGELKGVRQQVAHHLVEVDAVYPGQYVVALVLEGEGDVALRGIILVELADAADEVHQVGLTAVQLHLVLVNAALVQYLVDQQHQPVGVAVYGVDIRLALAVGHQ